MASLTIGNPLDTYEIASGATIEVGDIVALNASGKLVAASDTTSITVVGECVRVDDEKAEVHGGIISVKNDSTNTVTRVMRGKPCYVKDKSTVDSTGGTNKVIAGLVIEVYNGEVYVDVSASALAVARLSHASAAIADLTAASATAAQCATAINGILAALRKNGILASA